MNWLPLRLAGKFTLPSGSFPALGALGDLSFSRKLGGVSLSSALPQPLAVEGLECPGLIPLSCPACPTVMSAPRHPPRLPGERWMVGSQLGLMRVLSRQPTCSQGLGGLFALPLGKIPPPPATSPGMREAMGFFFSVKGSSLSGAVNLATS